MIYKYLMKRTRTYIAHSLSYKDYVLPYAVVTCDEYNALLSVSTFIEELPNAIFISGVIQLIDNEDQSVPDISSVHRVDLAFMQDLLSNRLSPFTVLLP